MGGFHCLARDVGKRIEMFLSRTQFPVRWRRMENAGNERATHLIGSVYLRGSPSSVLHIVLLHLGTNFWTGSDVTCRLNKGKKGKGKTIQRMSEQGTAMFFYQNWRNSNKSIIEMNVQPLLPSTTLLVIVAE